MSDVSMVPSEIGVVAIYGFAVTLGTATSYCVQNLRPEHRRRLIKWFSRRHSREERASVFCAIFDWAFGEDWRGPRFLLASLVSSVGTVFFLWMIFGPGLQLLGTRTEFSVDIWTALALALAINLIPDWLSFCQTRFFLGFMAKSNRIWVHSCLLYTSDAADE